MVEPVDLENSLGGCLDCNGGQPGAASSTATAPRPYPPPPSRQESPALRGPALPSVRGGPSACQQSLSELGALTAQRVVLGWRARSEVTGSPLSPQGAQLFGLRGLPSPHSPGLGVVGTLPCAPLPPVSSGPVQGRSLGPWARPPSACGACGPLGLLR